jgi:hypothetical protein
MRHIGANVIGANEINLDTHKAYVQRMLYLHRSQVWEHSRLSSSSSQISFDTNRKPGGTFLAVTGNSAGRVIDQGSDKLGRFCHISHAHDCLRLPTPQKLELCRHHHC